MVAASNNTASRDTARPPPARTQSMKTLSWWGATSRSQMRRCTPAFAPGDVDPRAQVRAPARRAAPRPMGGLAGARAAQMTLEVAFVHEVSEDGLLER